MTTPGLNVQALPVQPSPERLDLHNASIDQTAARAGMCGMIHLPTGRACGLPVHHCGSCHFVARDELSRTR